MNSANLLAGFTEEEVAEFRSQFLTYAARSGRALPGDDVHLFVCVCGGGGVNILS
jgi:hypothetical protein